MTNGQILRKIQTTETDSRKTGNLSKHITSKELVTKNISTKKCPGPDVFPGRFCQTKEKILHRLFQRVDKKGIFPN